MKQIERSATALWRRRSTFLLTLLAGLLVLLLVVVAIPRSYEATATIFVDPSERGTREQIDTSQGDLLSLTYRALAANPNVADRVLPELDMEISRNDLLAKMGFEAIPNTPLVEITATDGDPATAAAIANTYTRVFAGRVGDRFASGEVPSRIAITEPAVPPVTPAGPALAPLILAGILLSLLAAAAAALLRDRYARGIDLSGETETVFDQPVLARVPEAADGRALDDAIPAALADSLRSLRTGIELNPIDQRTLMISSRGVGEGRTTLATYMALAAASDGDRVALVECDLRNPGLIDTSLGARLSGARPGLAAFLAGRNRIDDVVQKDPALPWLNVVPAGDLPKDSGHLLRSPRLGDLLAYLREHNDWVIVDTPALGAGDDALLVVPHTDASLFVIDAKHTKPGAATAGLHRLQRAGSPVLGVVINRAAPEEYEISGDPDDPRNMDALIDPSLPPELAPEHPADRLLRPAG